MKLQVVLIVFILLFPSFLAFSSEKFIVSVKFEYKSGREGFYIHVRPRGAVDIFVPAFEPRSRLSDAPESFFFKARSLKPGEAVTQGKLALKVSRRNSSVKECYEVAREDLETFLCFVEVWTKVSRSPNPLEKKIPLQAYFLWALNSLKENANLRAKMAVLDFKKRVLLLFSPPFPDVSFEPRSFFVSKGFYVRGGFPEQNLGFSKKEKELLKRKLYFPISLECKKKAEDLFLSFERGKTETFAKLVRNLSFLVKNCSEDLWKKQREVVSAPEPFDVIEENGDELLEGDFVNLGSGGGASEGGKEEWQEL